MTGPTCNARVRDERIACTAAIFGLGLDTLLGSPQRRIWSPNAHDQSACPQPPTQPKGQVERT
ncbi:MAG: hypothetical protein HOJ54_00630 [Phycisphaerae bacterium]|nr:hypothetical protein [Phycisphaerae bacterium]